MSLLLSGYTRFSYVLQPGKRARSNSIGPSDIESEEEGDADEDVVMADAPRSVRLLPYFCDKRLYLFQKAKAREAVVPPIEILSDAETDTEMKSVPAKKRAVRPYTLLHFHSSH